MAREIFYTHQTKGACAVVCTCDCKHQMEKTVLTSMKFFIGVFDLFSQTVSLKNLLFSGEKVLEKCFELNKLMAAACKPLNLLKATEATIQMCL